MFCFLVIWDITCLGGMITKWIIMFQLSSLLWCPDFGYNLIRWFFNYSKYFIRLGCLNFLAFALNFIRFYWFIRFIRYLLVTWIFEFNFIKLYCSKFKIFKVNQIKICCFRFWIFTFNFIRLDSLDFLFFVFSFIRLDCLIFKIFKH